MMDSDYRIVSLGIHIAKKKHQCDELICDKRTIQPGEKYVRICYIDDSWYRGIFRTTKVHFECLSVSHKSDIKELLDTKGIPNHICTDGLTHLTANDGCIACNGSGATAGMMGGVVGEVRTGRAKAGAYDKGVEK